MVRVRFAPSPTGKLHLGSARTAVFNWLYARHQGGKFILRIEDTDIGRSDESFTKSIIKDMHWMGLDFEEYYKQSERFEIYREFINKLLSENKAYYCNCTREDVDSRRKLLGITGEALKYDGHCRGKTVIPSGNYVIRLDTGNERDISFKDIVKGKITVNTKELDDFVIQKSDGTPTYNFAVVIDDALMKISHIIRGEDHITNTAKQIILYKQLGFELPDFAHLPLVLDKDKTPLSKRKGSINIENYRASGILPEALINSIARLGWSHGNDEVLTLEQLIKFFNIDKLNKSNAVYDYEKMVWVNGKHIKMVPLENLLLHFNEFIEETLLSKMGKMQDDQWLLSALKILKNRHTTMAGLYDEILFFGMINSSGGINFEKEASDQLSLLFNNQSIKKAYFESKNILLSIDNHQNPTGLENGLRKIAEDNLIKFGELVQALRIVLTGKTATPDILSVISLMGEDIKERLEYIPGQEL